MNIFLLIALVCFGFLMVAANPTPFTVPLPFGSVDWSRNADGTTNFGTNSNVNILGYGSQGGLNFSNRGGRFGTDFGGGALVNGQQYGSNSLLGVDRQRGVDTGTNINMGPSVLRGGLGKEAGFFTDLANTARYGTFQPHYPTRTSNRFGGAATPLAFGPNIDAHVVPRAFNRWGAAASPVVFSRDIDGVDRFGSGGGQRREAVFLSDLTNTARYGTANPSWPTRTSGRFGPAPPTAFSRDIDGGFTYLSG
ncbi:hypothetical protein M3Y99_00299600 [Aphelenchoides fujianensis]|nr:hypothetical protein M3Y99_00299600 [Aphelenchoides fujianensis]